MKFVDSYLKSPYHRIYLVSALIAFTWWMVFNPGFYSSDSFVILDNIKNGKITSEWTAIWALTLNILTLGGNQPQLATLFFSQLLAASISFFCISFFKVRIAMWSSAILCATPLVGAMGITLWHDIPMTAGFLLVLGSIKKLEQGSKNAYILMLIGGFFASYRFNGLPTLIMYGLILLVFSRNKKPIIFLVLSLTLLAGVSSSLNFSLRSSLNVQTDGFIDWMRYDLSCYASSSDDPVFFKENFSGKLSLDDWSSQSSCIWFNDSKAFGVRTDFVNRAIPSAWLDLAIHEPWFIFKTHLDRHKYLVPIPFSGPPSMPFIHTTIETAGTNIRFLNPEFSEITRSYPRIWNYFNYIFGYAGFWLAVTFVIARWKRDLVLLKFGLLGLILNSGLFVFASISDARFALYVLILGQLIVVVLLTEWAEKQFHTRKISPLHSIRTIQARTRKLKS